MATLPDDLPGYREVVRRLVYLEALVGGGLPTIANTPPDSPLPYETVTGATAAFDVLQSTADDQDDRLTQLEAA